MRRFAPAPAAYSFIKGKKKEGGKEAPVFLFLKQTSPSLSVITRYYLLSLEKTELAS